MLPATHQTSSVSNRSLTIVMLVAGVTVCLVPTLQNDGHAQDGATQGSDSNLVSPQLVITSDGLIRPRSQPSGQYPGEPNVIASDAELKKLRDQLAQIEAQVVQIRKQLDAAAAGAGKLQPPRLVSPFRYEMRHDFTNSNFDAHVFDMPQSEFIKPGPKGLRMTLPTNQAAKPSQVGIASRYRIDGDFMVTAALEIDQLHEAAPGDGVGAYLFLKFRSGECCYMSRKQTAPNTSVWMAAQTRKDGSTDWTLHATAATSGKMQMLCSGNQVTFFAADGSSDEFRQLRQVELEAPAGVEQLSLAATNWRKGSADAAVVWRDLDIKSVRRPHSVSLGQSDLERWKELPSQ